MQLVVGRVGWSFCHTLRDDGVSYGDYLEQLTYLLFLKMADEYGKIYKKDAGIPDEYSWDSLKTKKGADLEAQYRPNNAGHTRNPRKRS